VEEVLSVIVLWLSINFALPAEGPRPKIEVHGSENLTQLWSEHVARHQSSRSHALQNRSRYIEIQAFYDDRLQTIYVARGWNVNKPKDLSILVHEVVHHMQNIGEHSFACRADRERLAYQAQDAWLRLFKSSLEVEFGIDPMTLLVRTRCMH